MSGPPGKRKAVADAGHIRTADREQSTPILTESDESGKFARLQDRSARAGKTLMRVPSGYMLVDGSTSHHTPSLETVASLLARRGGSE